MPIELFGWVQRLITNASEKGIYGFKSEEDLSKMWQESPFIRCHHRELDEYGEPKIGETCHGRTEMTPSRAIMVEGVEKSNQFHSIQS